MTEPELVKQCRKGDRKSQKKLFDLYSNRFYRLAVRYVNDVGEAEDVVMKAFVRIFEHLPQFTYHDTPRFESWMFTLVVNEALMALRRRVNFALTEALNPERRDHDTEIAPDTDAAYLYQLVLELPDGYRTVFNLHEIEGYDHREIAGMLNISESTSRSQLFKAKQLLKRKLNREGIQYGT